MLVDLNKQEAMRLVNLGDKLGAVYNPEEVKKI
jgi:hypothetical protein